MRNNDWFYLLIIIYQFTKSSVGSSKGVIIISTIILLMLWGQHGRVELLIYVLPSWQGPGSDYSARQDILSSIPWDHELLSFWIGAFLLVVIPMLIIKIVLKDDLLNYGLAMPPKGRRAIGGWGGVFLTLICLPAFVLAASDPEIASVYPMFKSLDSSSQIALYELNYLPFFISIEFIFRGYLLFGLAPVKYSAEQNDLQSIINEFSTYGYVLIIPMLSYTVWHFGKPLAELWGTLLWGLAAGAITYASRSIWPAVFSHWILNVLMDVLVLSDLFENMGITHL